MIFCSDHEEVGSESSSGAAGPFLEQLLRRLYTNPETYTQMIRNSLMVSCDNAHAAHPNFSEKHEPGHKPRMNGGAVIKINANQRYASNAFSIAKFAKAAQDAEVAIQRYVTRSDMGCGSTIGPITATRLGIETVDVGLPTVITSYSIHYTKLYEMMLFSDKLEELEAMNLDEPVAFKVKITHTEQFTRTSVLKIFTLKEATKEAKKVETKIMEKPPEPLFIHVITSYSIHYTKLYDTMARMNTTSANTKLE